MSKLFDISKIEMSKNPRFCKIITGQGGWPVIILHFSRFFDISIFEMSKCFDISTSFNLKCKIFLTFQKWKCQKIWRNVKKLLATKTSTQIFLTLWQIFWHFIFESLGKVVFILKKKSCVSTLLKYVKIFLQMSKFFWITAKRG